MFWTDIVLNTENSSEDAFAAVSFLAGKPFKLFSGRRSEARQKRNERASELFLSRSAKSSAAMSFGNTFGSKV